MKLSIARSELLEALTVASKGMSSRSTLPILSGVLLDASNGMLTLQSTDLEVSVKHSTAALTESDGQVVIPGKLLTDIVRSLPEAAVLLEKEGDVVSVRCQQASFTVKTHNPADFPRFPELSEGQSVSLPTNVLSSMVKKVSRAVSRDETRAILTGILLELDGPGIKMVATDSYRLAVAEAVLEESLGKELHVVAPARALEEVTRLAPSGGEITIGVSDNQLVFSFGETTFVTRRIEGTFPNYKQLIPKETETTLKVSTSEFQAAVKRVSLLAMHNTPLRIGVKIEDQTLSLSATTQDVGDASEDIMVNEVSGKDVEIAFNHAFLVDGLSVIADEEVRIDIQSALKPGLLKSGAEDGEKFLYLLMPVRLG